MHCSLMKIWAQLFMRLIRLFMDSLANVKWAHYKDLHSLLGLISD